MGSLAGHAVPGAFFIIYGALWIMNCVWYHLRSKSSQKSSGDSRTKKEKSASSSFFEFKRDYDLSRKSWIPLACTRLPVEPFLKIVLSALGLIVEVFFDYRTGDDGKRHLVMFMYSIWDSKGEMNDTSKLHHITMYGSFMLSGMMDVVCMCVKLPRQTSMMFLSIAFTVEGLLFYLHTMGRDMLNIEIHSLLVYAIFACVAFSVLRIFSATNIVINLGLGSSILLQGTWFVQAGYILFGGFLGDFQIDGQSVEQVTSQPTEASMVEDKAEHRYIMFVVACFAWHLVLVALFNVVVWVLFSLCLRSRVLHRRSFKRRGFLAGLRQGWKDTTPEEQSKLIVEEDELENGMEIKRMAETCT